MKNFLLSLVLAVAILAPAKSAFAIPASSVGVIWDYSNASGTGGGNVNTTNWSPLVATTSKAIKGITVLNNGAPIMELGIATSGSASTTEVRQLVINSRLAASGAQTSDPIFLPISISQGYRISIRALGSTATVGNFQLNAFYY